MFMSKKARTEVGKMGGRVASHGIDLEAVIDGMRKAEITQDQAIRLLSQVQVEIRVTADAIFEL